MHHKLFYLFLLFSVHYGIAQDSRSVARKMVDIMLGMVVEDGQGPTVQARNFFHTSVAMYDAWAAYDPNQETYFLGKNYHGFELAFDPDFKKVSKNIDSLREIAIYHAAYGVLFGRYNQYGSKGRTIDYLHDQLDSLGYRIHKGKDDYQSGSPEALGNYIANYIIELGANDNSREDDRHESEDYFGVNKNLRPELPGAKGLNDPNRWQPIDIKYYIDSKGYDKTLKEWNYLLIDGNTQFLTSYWGEVLPFALPPSENNLHFDPGAPPLFDLNDSISTEEYRWGFQLVQNMSGYLDPKNPEIWDTSPKGITSIEEHLPTTFEEYQNYYSSIKNNKRGKVEKNPFTKKKYPKNLVKQGDYCRVIAEFWVDGPNTASPPGHWLQFLNKVSYNPDFNRKWNGKGEILSQLEWDIKSYFLMTGALHDAGIACWSVKSHYDYIRPISAIRYLGGLGQSSNPELPNYHPQGLKLQKGSVALVKKDDPLVGKDDEHLNKIKIYSWKGPDAVNDPYNDTAGTGWVLAENWWPYQRYTFATPPFAGYTSGHSTFSTTGAILLDYMTGSPYFPNGLEVFTAKKNEFLLFEDGPSEEITLQWATFYDAAIETCLSRVWGGIHPPADDIEGRRMGKKVAQNTIEFAKQFFNK
ncbi:vanadium-dependent haloperoxidase [Aquimarina sp. 2201CG5-10]|uniref:vanadium-dependent haloperoxidase n=1 Tax=Aquimarina callyspongiae TaxID=3098150 RepID=UPI002AB39183|nr:vanadium-dependent haloperoxidase [Aquimarina sp. 2201CG5-10]MDY8135851.1 vanadium-dependent haloperoxidase [Aquimarina sp. 2201CG5-10]